jgi:hypothetical protein
MASSRHRPHAAALWLVRAFAPGCPTHLRSWSAKLGRRGERVTILYDLPDEKAKRAAADLARRAPSLTQVAIGSKAVRELNVAIEGPLMTVSALLVKA